MIETTLSSAAVHSSDRVRLKNGPFNRLAEPIFIHLGDPFTERCREKSGPALLHLHRADGS